MWMISNGVVHFFRDGVVEDGVLLLSCCWAMLCEGKKVAAVAVSVPGVWCGLVCCGGEAKVSARHSIDSTDDGAARRALPPSTPSPTHPCLKKAGCAAVCPYMKQVGDIQGHDG